MQRPSSQKSVAETSPPMLNAPTMSPSAQSLASYIVSLLQLPVPRLQPHPPHQQHHAHTHPPHYARRRPALPRSHPAHSRPSTALCRAGRCGLEIDGVSVLLALDSLLTLVGAAAPVTVGQVAPPASDRTVSPTCVCYLNEGFEKEKEKEETQCSLNTLDGGGPSKKSRGANTF